MTRKSFDIYCGSTTIDVSGPIWYDCDRIVTDSVRFFVQRAAGTIVNTRCYFVIKEQLARTLWQEGH